MVIISAILLGAGESKRMGVDKLSLPWGRKTVLNHCLETLLKSEVKEVIVVLSPREKMLKVLSRSRKVKEVVNPFFRKGMSTSIRRGIQMIPPNRQGILIALGDQPYLKTRTINALINAFEKRTKGIIVPSFQGRMGHPVIFHQRYKKELLSLKGDVGGRFMIERHLEDVRIVPVKSAGVVKDIDTWQDYTTSTLSLPRKRGGKGRGSERRWREEFK
jgi:molybdenum cofactor cytidylyltransferase